MPLYYYQCPTCECVVEKFQHNSEKLALECVDCKVVCDRIIGFVHSRVRYGARDNFERRIKPDANRIMNNISKGKDKDFLDITGNK